MTRRSDVHVLAEGGVVLELLEEVGVGDELVDGVLEGGVVREAGVFGVIVGHGVLVGLILGDGGGEFDQVEPSGRVVVVERRNAVDQQNGRCRTVARSDCG